MKRIPVDTVLESSRLFLKPPVLEDIPVIFKATRTPGFNEGMIWDPPEDESEMLPFFEKSLAGWQELKEFNFSAYERKSRCLTGRVGLHSNKSCGEEIAPWYIGYFTLPQYQGKGYGSEAVRRVVQFAFEVVEVEEITSSHAVWNEASGRILEKNGFQFVKHLPQGFQKRGEWVAEKQYLLTKERWQCLQEGQSCLQESQS